MEDATVVSVSALGFLLDPLALAIEAPEPEDARERVVLL
jgi:hypothetical protein